MLTIANTGEDAVNFKIKAREVEEQRRGAEDREGPQRDDPGDLIGSFDGIDINAANNYSSCVGWDRDNEMMWATCYNTGQAAAYFHDADYENFEEEVRITPGSSMDGTWANGVFWWLPWGGNAVAFFDRNGRNVGGWNSPNALYGLGWDEEENWIIAMGTDMVIRIYQNNENNEPGELLGSIPQANHMQFHNNVTAYGLEWVSAHRDGQLSMTSESTNRVYQILVDTEEWTCTGSPLNFQISNGDEMPYCSVAHDGKNVAAGYAESASASMTTAIRR